MNKKTPPFFSGIAAISAFFLILLINVFTGLWESMVPALVFGGATLAFTVYCLFRKKARIAALVLFTLFNGGGWAVSHLYGYVYMFHNKDFHRRRTEIDRRLMSALIHDLKSVLPPRTPFRILSFGVGRKQFFRNYFTPWPVIRRESDRPDHVFIQLRAGEKKTALKLKSGWIDPALTNNAPRSRQALKKYFP